jgi:hypothetical protein
MLRRAKKDGDALYIGELKAVEGLTCAPKRREAVRVVAWAVGGARRARAPARVRRCGQRSGGTAGTRGERGQGEQGGAAQVGGATARGPADRGRSRRAVWRRFSAGRAARRATSHAWARTPSADVLQHSTWPCSTAIYSKFFNRSGPSDQQQSCRSPIPLQLS